MDGDPLDACSIATYVALNCTKIPKVEIFLGESGSPEDFEVNGDLGEALSLQARNIPICISSSKVSAGPLSVLLLIADVACCRRCCGIFGECLYMRTENFSANLPNNFIKASQ